MINLHRLCVLTRLLTPPQLVMNNFTSPTSDASSKTPKHLESLTTTVFQSLFPPINPTTTPLKSIRRVLLLNREQSEEDGSFVVNFRHYAITTKATGLSKPLKRINAAEKLLGSKSKKAAMPNLSKLQDISEFINGGENGDGYTTDATSGSEIGTDDEVEVLETAPRRVLTAKARAAAAEAELQETPADERVERRGVKLVELGPRMKLRMTKVEEGLCAGKVMWHEYIHKTKEEIRELEKTWEKRKKEKDARRQQQKENVEKKQKAKAEQRAQGKDGEDEDEMDVDDLGSDAYDYMDDGEEAFDSEGLEGDIETQIHERMEENGEWESEEEDIADGG